MKVPEPIITPESMDDILNYLKSGRVFNHNQVVEQFENKYHESNIGMILTQFVADGLIHKVYNINSSCELTAKGRMFEGFLAERNKLSQQAKDLKYSLQLSKKALNWTIIGVVIAVIALLVAVIK